MRLIEIIMTVVVVSVAVPAVIIMWISLWNILMGVIG